jgi:hypothetical protein
MSIQHSGSCLCGQIKFEVEGSFDGFFLCHCTHCQKGTGSAHGANLFSASAKVKWLQGRERVTSYNLPGTRHVKSFCSQCGSAMPTEEYNHGQFILVPAGSLDTKLEMKPTGHLFLSSKAAWENDLELAPKFDKLPG